MFTNTFSVPEKQSFLSTYFGLTHVFALPLGRCYFRRCYVTPLGGIVPSHRLSPSREEINELLPRHQQSSVKCLTILVQVEDYPERSLLYPRDFFSLSKAMEAYLTRQLNCRPMQERPSNDPNLQISKSVWVALTQPSLALYTLVT